MIPVAATVLVLASPFVLWAVYKRAVPFWEERR